jgi:LysM repeat protein
VAISGYAYADRHAGSYLTARLGAVNAEAVMVDQGGAVGDVNLGRYSTIIKPVAIPMSAPPTHLSSTYTVQVGENLSAIATKFHVTVSQIRWSNADNLTTTDAILPGEHLVIPPVPGVAVTVKAGDTLTSLATTYKVDPASVADYNRLRDTSELPVGLILVIPDGVGPDFPPPPALYQIRNGSGGAMATTVISCCLGPYPATGFPVGWCTYYVATKRNVTWRGDAGYWYDNAMAQGYAVGPTPKLGAIMVTWESYLGHVAYVESVNADGSWTVSEMNYVAFDVIDLRTIKPGQLGSRLVGFIY